MILSLARAGIEYGKQAAAIAWAAKFAAHMNTILPGSNVRVTRAVGGPVAEVYVLSEFASLADYETRSATLETDAGYQALLKEARDGGLFDARTLRIELHQTVG
jgi:hypothetical protein